MTVSPPVYGAPGHPSMPEGYEYSYLPHDFGGPWSQPLLCKRCGAVVIGKTTTTHNEWHDTLSGSSASDATPTPDAGDNGPDRDVRR